MPSGVWIVLFTLGTAVSLASSYVLVTRLERLGERAGMSEALLGMVAALAADAPEITAAVVALAHGQGAVGAGVVVGSNVFNLAALLGLGAVVAGWIGLHRHVVLLSGSVAVWVAMVCVLAVLGVIGAPLALALTSAVIAPYLVVLGLSPGGLRSLPIPAGWAEWLAVAVHDEDTELDDTVAARRGTGRDAVLALVMLAVVVAASTVMEAGATTLGSRFGVADIVTGGLVLAVVTSLPNAVAAVYLAARGRGAAVLSTALNSNALNVVVGLLLPATITGMGPRTGEGVLVAVWYAGLTLAALAFAYRDRALTRATGAVIIGGYLVFVGALLAAVCAHRVTPVIALAPAGLVGLGCVYALIRPAAGSAPGGHPRWNPTSVWALSALLCLAVAVIDAGTGRRLVLMSLLTIGPCTALFTARWRRTASVALLALGLAVLLGVPDGVFGTDTHYALLASIAVVGLCTVTGAAVLERHGASPLA
ncbi:hypothetical protein KDL01_06900 [Actinospica durhamensis]|uniref:Sodium/calcium exchanger membrane region domain-containing protein n=1 Tax=Actinospica durhamensis TaxID=1508375 RepID=A0A941EMA7_9ACTN|nr:hypothetical protein [Actinospica durhamensis]MBR7832983.1 hypothetical protein [Actinospica durhamensis]